jgi:enamine deaminase RidA (YjgF/YER057c/UK114 family)
MARRSIETDTFRHQNPIPGACRIGPLVESSIIVPVDPVDRSLPDSLDAQIANLFTHMAGLLADAGATWDDMCKITFFVADANASRAALNGPWTERFPDPASRPARHNLEIPMSGKMQISCVFTAYVEG